MNSASRARLAIINNAVFCDRVCRSHHIPGAFHEHYWHNSAKVPRFYPNMVTLTEGRAAAEQQMAKIGEAVGRGSPPGEWSIKDSFGALELGRFGLVRLFESTWIWRQPSARAATNPVADVRWARVTDPLELARTPSHSPRNGNGGGTEISWVGQPGLIVFAASSGGGVVGGAVANVSGGVIGLSNVSGPSSGLESLWLGAVAAVCSLHPGMPLVGYERGADLGHARAAGFEPLHSLSVWSRAA
jgi:hypothetical protein